MAYSDYGAYIWKNGENITNECADVSCKIIEGKFVFKNWYDNLVDEVNKNENEKEKTISGHALINLEKFCISFYKTYNPIGVRIDIWTHFMRGCIIDYVH